MLPLLDRHHVVQIFDLVYLQGDRGTSGVPGPPGDIGIGFPGAKVPPPLVKKKKWRNGWNTHKVIPNNGRPKIYSSLEWGISVGPLRARALFYKATPMLKKKLR